MAFEADGKKYRNLEEQVAYLTKELQDTRQTALVLAQMGIRVVGEVPDEEDLPDPETYGGEYGDAYITEDNNHYHIWTRPWEGDEYGHWYDVGVFPAPGPQGPQGVPGQQGEPGQRGSRWIDWTGRPPVRGDEVAGDMCLNAEGRTWIFVKSGNSGYWNLSYSIRGPQGVPGPQGEPGESIVGPQGEPGPQGQPGEAFDIIGQLNSPSDLPTPSTDYLNDAYLIPDNNGAMHLWVIYAGETPLAWHDVGALTNYGTMVTVGGVYQQTFNADTKMTKPNVTDMAVIIDENGNVSGRVFTQNAMTGHYSFVYRNAQGFSRVKTPQDSAGNTNDDDIIVNKGYAKTLRLTVYTCKLDIKASDDTHIYTTVFAGPSSFQNDSLETVIGKIASYEGRGVPIPAVFNKQNGGDMAVGYIKLDPNNNTTFYYWYEGLTNEVTQTTGNVQDVAKTTASYTINPTHQ